MTARQSHNFRKRPDGKNDTGRPRKVIDYKMVDKLANILCTQDEIAAFLDMGVSTLRKDKKFVEVFKKGVETGHMSLRRAQYKNAMGGNTTMQIWLGKQHLNQSDKHDVTGDMTLDVKVTWK